MPKRVVKLKDVWGMLKECAPGFTTRETKHHHLVRYKDHSFNLQLGDHGKRRNPEIEAGHVRSMTFNFGITECAKKHLSKIFSPPKKPKTP